MFSFIFAHSFAGKSSGAGMPAAKDMMSFCPKSLKISLIADGFKALTLSLKIYSISLHSNIHKFTQSLLILNSNK